MRKAGQENLHHLFQCLHRLGVRQVFICPGSRNAPLINAAVAQSEFDLYSVVDERAAGYMALGAAQITQKPTVVLCTSGTALLNLFPAVAEAHQLHIPMIVLSADRPTQFLNRWENQTIDQNRVFGKYTNTYIEWKGKMELVRTLGKVERIASKINAYTQFPDKGVVHVNFHFSEPLYFPEPIKKVEPFSLSDSIKSHTETKISENKKLSGKKLMVLCGTSHYNEGIAKEIEILKDKGALIFCDITSPYRKYGNNTNWELFANSVSEDFWSKNKPDTIITTGSFLLNKNLKNLIRKKPPETHIHLADTQIVRDTFFSKPTICNRLGDIFFNSIKDNIPFKSIWTEKINRSTIHFNKVVENSTELNDLWAVNECLKVLPQNAVLHLANSMSVRYAAVCVIDNNITIYANRGTSGIDGCIATAVGAALADKEHEHYLISGDLAFFYGINGFWLNRLPGNLKILLLNNHGGNIFDMIPGPSASNAKHYFTTPHNRSAKHIASDYGLTYLNANSLSDYRQTLPAFIKSSTTTVFEIMTTPDLNVKTWKQLKE
ncbi:MAG: 2-succinyl-5-enolpyruvyl-6-hydroxy-3-cyclohexene-1-carboxylic-acid synthase [Bacteroidetes bacterium]|nr:2-succinyl-5-enolpyruvyl-6-hydroxy-3-cyclohexene-1-carboxylic-acid synthase [Bacteroidota bacterium]